ncbi:PAS domain-containing sensor histidine kinase [Flavobacterium flavipallidum]|uniref:histidine kinase n=1 Tax=Flavobacterium flavipallidum TaxID=3139140 RepID=A0ABU9HPR7_9FLAO
MKTKQDFYIKETVAIGKWDLDLSTKSFFWDKTTKEIFEVPEYFVPSFKNATTFFNRKNLISFKAIINKAIENKTAVCGKFEILSATNKTKQLECFCQVEFDLDTIIRIYGFVKDISIEEKRINKLESIIQKYSSVFSNIQEALIIVDINSKLITNCNDSILKLSSYTRTELIGSPCSILFPAEDKKCVDLDTPFVKETLLKTKNGDLIPVKITAQESFTIDDHVFLVCSIKDITKKKQTEENLNLLSLVASETTDSIVILNLEGKAIWTNQAYMELIGLTADEIIDKHPDYLNFGIKNNLESINKISHAVKNKKGTSVVLYHFNKKQEKCWLELNITPIVDINGICIKFIGIGRDITAAKQKEIELKKILEVTNQQNNKLLNFTHIVSHNIRSHTSNLLMVLDVIENTDDTTEKLSFIEMFKEGAEKLSETIENLNEVITIQKNTNTQKTSVNFKTELEKSLIPYQNKLSISYTIPEDLMLNVIPTYLENILQNLLDNAVKYQSPDRFPKLEISHKNMDGFEIISFKDNGLGINIKKNKHKLFGMYKTFHNNDDAKGIGLFIVKNQIETMKGKIEVESKEGQGSTFKLFFNEK